MEISRRKILPPDFFINRELIHHARSQFSNNLPKFRYSFSEDNVKCVLSSQRLNTFSLFLIVRRLLHIGFLANLNCKINLCTMKCICLCSFNGHNIWNCLENTI